MTLLTLLGASGPVDKTGADTGTSTEASTVGLVGADTGTAVEASSITVTLAGSDTGTGVEAQTALTSAIITADIGTGVDASTSATTLTGEDGSSGVRVFTPGTTILDQDTTFFSAWGSDTSWTVDFSQADYGSTLYQQIIVGIAEEGLASLTFVIVEGQNDVPTISYASTETDDWLQPDTATFRIVIDETGTGSFYLDGVLQYEIPDVIGDVSVSAFVFAESDDTTSTWTVGVPGTAEASTVSAEVVDDDPIVSAEDSDLEITLLAVPKSGADTITSVEAGTLTATLVGSDLVVGVDAQALAVTATGTDTSSAADTAALAATLTGADTVTSIEAGTLAVPVSSADTGTSTEGQTVSAGDASVDSVLSGEATTIVAILAGADTGSVVDAQTLTVQVSGADTITAVESDAVIKLFAGADAAIAVDAGSLVASPQGSDTGSAAEDGTITVTLAAEDAAMFTEEVTLAVELAGTDTGQLSDEDAADTPKLAFPAATIPYPSIVQILRPVRVRVDGSLRVTWEPLAAVPTNAGTFPCRFDLAVPPPGKEGLPPQTAGVVMDRIGLMMCDTWVATMLRAGHRIKCLTGPVVGIFDVRNTPSAVVAYDSTHHLEVEVTSVAQGLTGTVVPADYPVAPSMIRHLYASRVEVLRRMSVRGDGATTETWVKVEDMVDPVLGTAGELLCRIDLHYQRMGKDVLPPIVAGRMQDRVGTLVCDSTPYLRAGDRLRCVSGAVSGTFELKVTPDTAPDLTGNHHLETQVVEVAQSAVVMA